jgi:hypothetical protein
MAAAAFGPVVILQACCYPSAAWPKANTNITSIKRKRGNDE